MSAEEESLTDLHALEGLVNSLTELFVSSYHWTQLESKKDATKELKSIIIKLNQIMEQVDDFFYGKVGVQMSDQSLKKAIKILDFFISTCRFFYAVLSIGKFSKNKELSPYVEDFKVLFSVLKESKNDARMSLRFKKADRNGDFDHLKEALG